MLSMRGGWASRARTKGRVLECATPPILGDSSVKHKLCTENVPVGKLLKVVGQFTNRIDFVGKMLSLHVNKAIFLNVKISLSELEESLLVLPFDYVIDMFTLMLEWMKVSTSCSFFSPFQLVIFFECV